MSTGGPLEGPWAKAGVIAGVLGTIAAIVFGIAQLSSGTSTGAAAQTPGATATATDGAGPTSTGGAASADDEGGSTSESRDDGSKSTASDATSRKKYLSEIRVTDHDSASSTGGWETGAKDINGEQFGHSIMTYSGCQNDDGGDFWVDLTIGSGWRRLSGTVGLTGDSSVESTGSWQILDPLSDRELASGTIAAGPGSPIEVDLTGITRLRLFMNNPNAPKQTCGFAKISTRLVWGDVVLNK